MGGKWKQWQVLFSWAPISLWTVTAAMKLKDTSPWKESYDKPSQSIKKQKHHFADKVYIVKAMVFPAVMYGYESWTIKKTEHWRITAFKLVLVKTHWEFLQQQGDQTSQSSRKSVLNIHWKDWCWSCSSNTLVTWWEESTHWKRPRCWERLRAEGEGNNRG